MGSAVQSQSQNNGESIENGRGEASGSQDYDDESNE